MIKIVGDLFAGEILLFIFLAASYLTSAPGRSRLGRRVKLFLILLCMLATGMVLADAARGTPPSDYLRGWGRVALLGTDIAAMGLFARRGLSTLVWYVVGYSVGGLVYCGVEGLNIVSNWKLGYAIPSTLLGSCILCTVNSKKLRVFFLMLFAASNFVLDYRSLAGFCVAGAAVEMVIGVRLKGPVVWVLMSALLCVSTTTIILVLVNQNSQVMERQDESNYDRLMRMKFSMEAIVASPLLGYGSWPRDRALADEYIRAMSLHVGHRWWLRQEERDLIPSHSQIMQAWVEAGILGIPFFCYLIVSICVWLRRLVSELELGPATGLVVVILTWSLWDALFSPFSGQVRIAIAITVALMAALDRLFQARSAKRIAV
ncbi:MAG TPA: O-antigen ligase family protein [Tepidisphaeraceae bacterium]|nr:O-antigen ligase family protein [Tepidisphaeraceae bacterium]